MQTSGANAHVHITGKFALKKRNWTSRSRSRPYRGSKVYSEDESRSRVRATTLTSKLKQLFAMSDVTEIQVLDVDGLIPTVCISLYHLPTVYESLIFSHWLYLSLSHFH